MIFNPATMIAMTTPPFSITSPETLQEDNLDNSLRPERLQHYIGQEQIKQSLQIALEAAKARRQPVDHILLYGPPGLGKTSLAFIIAREMGTQVRVASGPALTRAGDLAAILTNLQEGDVLFIDEIHRLNRTVEETLYPAMEDRALDIILGKGPSARTVRIDLPAFTLVGATTRAGSLTHPLRERFGIIHRLEYYDEEELASILARSAHLLKLEAEHTALMHVASRSRRTPRVANRLLRRIRDFAEVYKHQTITESVAREALDQLLIDQLGLDRIDRSILEIIQNQFTGGPVGLETLAAASGEEAETLEDIVEPYLLRLGFIERTPRGRVITQSARDHLANT